MSRGKPSSYARPDPARRVYLGRELSARTVLFHEAVGQSIGLSATEHKCLDLLLRSEAPITAGQLADLAGLTTGAITGILDRLERRGFVRREHGQVDRRQVLIYPQQPRQKEYNEILDGLAQAVARADASYTEQEQAVIYSYFERMIEILKEQTAKLLEETGLREADGTPKKWK